MPALVRIKRGVRAGIALCGGIDGAAATADRSRSVAGDWNALNHRALPSLDCAFALDEVAVAKGEVPPIAAAYCRELGGVFVPNIDPCADEDSLAGMLMQLMHELGDVSGELQRSLADDGATDSAEADRILQQLDELDRASARMRAALRHIMEGGK
ncbi:phage regulatory CII family protein [Novosphingobium sp.]|uniref:phage regulatory CII family protein n=1 Tax=Novosphingobium sp. TaxID=1874826 RepID=UPI0038B6E439